MIHYIIFHPDCQRDNPFITGEAIIQGSISPLPWSGKVWVDSMGNGQTNEDPFVFNDSWMYSYCHATQLKRNSTVSGRYLDAGSYIIFCSGDKANQGLLEIDTIFVVGKVHFWQTKPSYIPTSLMNHKSSSSPLWMRHLKLGLPSANQHLGKFTYEAEMWAVGKSDFSFLPLDIHLQKVSIPFNKLGAIGFKIASKVKGKYPVQLNSSEITCVLPCDYTQISFYIFIGLLNFFE